jgi:hypothetical protein
MPTSYRAPKQGQMISEATDGSCQRGALLSTIERRGKWRATTGGASQPVATRILFAEGARK